MKTFIILSILGSFVRQALSARAAAVSFIETTGIFPDVVYETKRIQSQDELNAFDAQFSQ